MAERNIRKELADAVKALNNLKFDRSGLQEELNFAETRMGYEKGIIDNLVAEGKQDSGGYRNGVRKYREAKARRDAAQKAIDDLQKKIDTAQQSVTALEAQAKGEVTSAAEARKKAKAKAEAEREAADRERAAATLRSQAAAERDLGNVDRARDLENQANMQVLEADKVRAAAEAAVAPERQATWRGEAATATPVRTNAAQPTGTQKPAGTQQPTTKTTTTATGTKTKTAAGTTTTTTGTPAAPKADAAKPDAKLTAEQQARLGQYGSQYLINYFKKNETKYTVKDPVTGKTVSIYAFLRNAALRDEDPANVSNVLKNTTWYTNVNERVKAPIFAAGQANGITLSEAEIDQYRDQQLAGLLSADEIQSQIRNRAIDFYKFESKPEIANGLRSGKDLDTVLSDYADQYMSDLGIAQSQFDVGSKEFLDLVMGSKTFDDFKQKVRRTDKFLEKREVQNAISANVSNLKTKYLSYGMKITDADAQRIAKNLYLGDITTESIDDNLRKVAADTFQPFRDRILNGEDPLSLATPYISAMSRILEVPNSALDLEDPTVRRAMMGSSVTKGETTSHAATPLWEFEQQLYRDNRWQYTANARATMDQVSLDVLSRFGVIG